MTRKPYVANRLEVIILTEGQFLLQEFTCLFLAFLSFAFLSARWAGPARRRILQSDAPGHARAGRSKPGRIPATALAAAARRQDGGTRSKTDPLDASQRWRLGGRTETPAAWTGPLLYGFGELSDADRPSPSFTLFAESRGVTGV